MENVFKEIDLFVEKINQSKNIVLTAHVNPDGDSIGSTLALAYFIENKMKKDVNMIIEDNIPSSFRFLPNIEEISSTSKNIGEVDLLITLDCGNLDRLALNKSIVENASYIINIDHHITNTKFGNINIVDYDASSTGEVIYELVNKMNYEISLELATCIYVSISTDTGSFKYTNTTSKTHEIVSDLLKKEIDLETINRELYQNRSLEKTKLLIAGMNNVTLLRENTVGIVAVDSNMLEMCNAKTQESEIIVDFIRDIDVVDLACVIRPIDEYSTKVSLRAKKNIDVSKIALVFGGGGHAKAAGCTIKSGIVDAEKIITTEILRYLGE